MIDEKDPLSVALRPVSRELNGLAIGYMAWAANHPLARLSNVVLTPHIAAGTRDALTAKMHALFAKAQRFYRGEPLANRVF